MSEPIIIIDPGLPREVRYTYLAQIASEVIAPQCDLLSAMSLAVNIIGTIFPEFSWVGFYRLVHPLILKIGPFRGTLPCIEIPFHKGVCGAAARDRRSIIVPDVSAFPGHIACDSSAKSEIVLPLIDENGSLLGVLDIDSARLDDFRDVDREGLESIAMLVARSRG
jgi:L-methionine (R)-S-oxide reductase